MQDIQYNGQSTYLVQIAGLKRELPLVEVEPGEWIASFVLLGDTELVEACGRALAAKLKSWKLEALLVPEGRGLALAHVIAAQLSTPDHFMPYIVVRKGVKAYMQNPLVHTINTITTSGQQELALDRRDAVQLRGRRVCVLDDLISTGGTTRAIVSLGQTAGAEVACVSAVLLEGAEAVANPAGKTDGIPVVWLEAIPRFVS